MEPYIIDYASFYETRLIDASNTYHASINIKKAKEMAREANLDLVCFNNPSKNTLALCKIIDYGKFKYQQEKSKKKECNKKPDLKEIRITPVIDMHDMDYKIKNVIEFLKDGHEVLVTMRFKGIHHRMLDEGERILNLFIDKCKENGKEVSRKKTNDNITVRITK
jgi:translation initiation factor IF-3